MKIKSIPKRGRKGSTIYSKTRHGNVAREYVPPANPRSEQQQAHRDNVRADVAAELPHLRETAKWAARQPTTN